MGRDIAVTAYLADEPAARLQRARHAGGDELRRTHPVQSGVGEDGVELTIKGELMAIGFLDAKSARRGDRQQIVAEVGAEHIGAGGRDLRRQSSVAAAEIENAFAGLCGQLASASPARSCTKRPLAA